MNITLAKLEYLEANNKKYSRAYYFINHDGDRFYSIEHIKDHVSIDKAINILQNNTEGLCYEDDELFNIN